MVNFPTWIPDCDSHNPALLDLFISSDASICSTMVFPRLRYPDQAVVSVSIDFPLNSKQDAPFHQIAYDFQLQRYIYINFNLNPLTIFTSSSRSTKLKDIFKFGTSAAASECREWVQIETDVYIPHCKYQIKPHSSPCFSAACTDVIVHRNHFLHLYQQSHSSESKVNFRQTIVAKGFLKLANLSILIKQQSIAFQKLGYQNIW